MRTLFRVNGRGWDFYVLRAFLGEVYNGDGSLGGRVGKFY